MTYKRIEKDRIFVNLVFPLSIQNAYQTIFRTVNMTKIHPIFTCKQNIKFEKYDKQLRLPAGSAMVNKNKRAYLFLISGARSWFPEGNVISFMAYRHMISFYWQNCK